MSLQAEKLTECDVMRELEEAWKAKKAGHEVEWMANLMTGQMEPDEVGSSQVVDGGLVETNEGAGVQSMAVNGAHCAEAFMSTEVRYQDEESDEGTINTNDIETVQLEILRDGFDQ